MTDRIVELEVKVAYQDRLIADLDDVVQGFAARVEALEQKVAELEEANANEPLPIGPANDPPPHY